MTENSNTPTQNANTGNVQAPQANPPKINQFMGNPASSSFNASESPEDLLLNDPKKFVEKIRADVRQEIGELDGRKKNLEKMWNDFYQTNPDLKDVDWHVQSVLGEKLVEWSELPVAEATKKLAEESRRRIDLIKSKVGVRKEELTSTSAVTFPSSGESATALPATGPKPTTFIEELVEMKQRRRKS